MNTSHSAFGQFSLLVVDDSDFARAQISSLLKEKGFNVVGEASGAEEALKLIKELKPHLVLADIVMPNVSGIELAEKITNNFPNVGVIMVSSLAHEQVVLEAIAAGAVDFVRKPIDVLQLTEAVEKYLTSIKKD